MHTAVTQESSLYEVAHDEKDNAQLIAYVDGNDESTITELVLADRLKSALYEIDLLVKEHAELLGIPAPVQH